MRLGCPGVRQWFPPPAAMACTLRPSCGCRAAAPLRSRRAAGQPLLQLLGRLCSSLPASARLALQDIS